MNETSLPTIDGIFLFREVILKKRILVSRENMPFVQGRHRVTDLDFSPELREDPFVLQHLKLITERLIRFFSYMEEEDLLSLPEEVLSGEVSRLLQGQDLTGMAALRLAYEDLLTFREFQEVQGTKAELYVQSPLWTGIPNASLYWTCFLERIYSFDSQTPAPSIEVFPMDDFPQKLSEEEEDSKDFLVQGTGHSLEELIREEEERKEKPEDQEILNKPGHLENLDDQESQEDRELSGDPYGPSDRILDTLKTLHGILSSMEEETGLELITSFSELSFLEGRTERIGDLEIPVPDGFLALPGRGEGEGIFYLPNRENPEEAEASLVQVFVTVGEKPEVRVRLSGISKDREKLEEAFARDFLGFLTGS